MWRPALLALIGSALLLGSWLYPPTHLVWSQLDIHLFELLNGSLDGHPVWHALCASTLSVESDLVLASILLLLVTPHLRGGRLLHLLWVAGVGLGGLALVRFGLDLTRLSPSLSTEPFIASTGAASWLHIREGATHSFPSDHAFALLYASLFFFTFGRAWQGLTTLGCLLIYGGGRLVTGAHWLSDMVVGSVSLVLVLFALAVAGPLHRRLYIGRFVSDSQPDSVTSRVSSSRTPPTPGR